MTDDPTKYGRDDRIRINVHETYEIRYWTKKFKCTKKELAEAVAAVGPMAEDVNRFLILEKEVPMEKDFSSPFPPGSPESPHPKKCD